MSVTDNTGTHETSASRTATIWPISLAVGVAVLLVGLIVNPEVIAPLGGAITVVAAAAWIRGGRQGEQPSTSEETAPQKAERDGERYTRNRLLERATLGLGGIVAGATVAALPRRAPIQADHQQGVEAGIDTKRARPHNEP